jgi:hypothetical protein
MPGNASELSSEGGGLPHFKASRCKPKTVVKSLEFTLE